MKSWSLESGNGAQRSATPYPATVIDRRYNDAMGNVFGGTPNGTITGGTPVPPVKHE